MIYILLAIFTGAVVAPFLNRLIKRWIGIALSMIPLTVFVYLSTIFETISDGQSLQYSFPWVEQLGIHLSFYVDGLSLLFLFLIIGIGFLILVYSNSYMQGEKLTGRYYGYMLFFMGAMVGLVTSDNLISLYVFWELTSISSFFLINLKHHEEKSRAAGLQALLITTLGGLALMAGFILTGTVYGTYELSELLNTAPLTSGRYYLPIVILILLGAFTKSAQFPFHFWLPSAMAAPTPVSAYLHSAAMVNAGIYLIARLNPLFGNTDIWQIPIIVFGLITMFTGAYFSLTQRDLKRILAYATVSALGTMMLLLGIGTVLSVKAALLYLMVHAFYKATLFMVTGIIDKKTGTRDIFTLGNLWKTMPVLTITALLALASKASLPPMMGYISKKMIFAAKVQFLEQAPYLLILGFVSFVFLFTISILVAYEVFFRKSQTPFNKNSKIGLAYLFGPVILSVLSFLTATFPEQFELFIEFAAESVKGREITVDLELWHGLTNVFLLSTASMVLGILLFVYRKKIFPFFIKINNYLILFELSNVFLGLINGLLLITKKITRLIQHGYHRFYLLTVFIVIGLSIWVTLILKTPIMAENSYTSISLPVVGIVLMAILAAVITVFTKSKITAIITMGVTGYALALLFMIHGATDLAITFIIVDTLTLVLFVMVTLKLPEFERFSSVSTRIRDGFIAMFFGGCMFFVALATSLGGKTANISDFYLEHSLPEGFGKNVVNVILVDFRALDTLGEAIVVFISALSIYTLFKLKLQKK